MTEMSATGAPTRKVAYQRTDRDIPRSLRRILALDDFEPAARRILPRMLYGYISGAVETGSAHKDARDAYNDFALVPSTLVDVAGRSQAHTLLGRTYDAPFGLPPIGGAAVAAYDGDIEMARACAWANIPGCLSAASLTRLEDVRRAGPNTWFQGYLPGDQRRIDAMVDRVAAAGYDTLVVTVDVPVLGNRENNVRNGYSTPFVLTPRLMFDCGTHPRWLLGTLARTFWKRGMMYFENLDATRGPPIFSKSIARNTADRDRLAWPHIAAIRARWAGKLIIKGILTAQDASLAREHGADAVVVSNHGGRQLDFAVSPLSALPEVKAVAGDMPVIIDGGIRRGTDVLKALALGADFCLVGRPFMFAAVIGGATAVEHGINLLKDEIDRDMALMGITSLDQLSPNHLRRRR